MRIAVIHLQDCQDDESEINNQYELLANLSKKHTIVESQKIDKESVDQQDLIILLSPRRNFIDQEVNLINSFLLSGGGILLTMGHNQDTDIDEFPDLKNLTDRAGITLKENYNDTPETLTDFHPHFITANIRELDYPESGYYLKSTSSASKLATAHDPELLMIAASNVENGKLVVISNSHIFSAPTSTTKSTDNALFIENIVEWLTGNNPFDLTTVEIPKSAPWGSTAEVRVGLIGNNKHPLSYPVCILDSVEPTKIDQPCQAIYGLSSNETIYKEWAITPKNIGNQKLILDIKPDENSNDKYRYYLPLPCLAQGVFNLQTKNNKGDICNNFMTNETITVSGLFQWSSEIAPKPLELKLIHGKELIIIKDGKPLDTTIGIYHDHAKQWKMKAVEEGCHEIQLQLKQSDQTHSHFVKINASSDDKMVELNALYVVPLEAEITERLRLIDSRLVDESITTLSIKVLPPSQYIHTIYKDKDTRDWLDGLIESAWRENYFNEELISLISEHFFPTYIPDIGILIPCDPALSAKLCNTHPRKKILIEHALLYSNESSPLEIKQHLFAFITHEKFGHGFVSNQTILGKQIVLLEKYESTIPNDYIDVSKRILDSSILIEEGFSAWLEIYLLESMPTEIMQSVYIRKNMLFNSSSAFKELCEESDFFSDFNSRYTSRYREAYEYLEYLTTELSVKCAIDAFLFATNIDFGIRENEDGILFQKDSEKLYQMITIGERQRFDSCAHKRLEAIVEYLKDNVDEQNQASTLVRSNNYLYSFDSPSPLESLFNRALINS